MFLLVTVLVALMILEADPTLTSDLRLTSSDLTLVTEDATELSVASGGGCRGHGTKSWTNVRLDNCYDYCE